MHLGTSLAGIELEHPLMNAAGTCKTSEDVRKFAQSAVSAVMLGSITLEERPGNRGDVYWPGPAYSLNSLGMPNRGLEWYRQQLPTMAATAAEMDKPLFVSVAGFSVDEYAKLAYEVLLAGADHVELNLGCPNVWEQGHQKRIACFDLELLEGLLVQVSRWIGTFSVKLSPYSDPALLEEVARLIAGHDVGYVATANTFPNALVLSEAGKPVIDVGLAGMSGAAMKPVGLGQVKQLRRLLPDSIQIVGVGGVMNGRDMWEYLHVGATAVQSATAYWNANENPGVFGDILSSYIDQLTEEIM